MLRVALTHDVDRIYKSFQYLTYVLKSLYNFNIDKINYHLRSIFIKNTYWCFPKIVEIEKSYNLRSTFYFLNETIPFNLFKPDNWKLSLGRYNLLDENVVNIIKYLDTNGWEIGLHGSYLSYNNKDLLLKEKNTLESIVGHKVIGIRQHYLNLSEFTWNVHSDLGFKYDTSFGYNNKIGYKDNKVNVFFPLNNTFAVFPMAIMDTCYMSTHNRLAKLKKMIELTIENNAILVVNWHQRSFNENEFPGYIRAYCEIIEECMDNGATFKLLSQFYSEGFH